MDIKRLVEECDAQAVVDYLQMEHKQSGRYTYILCPGHEERLGKPDTNMGNAVLREKGYYCYACNAFVTTHDMIMEYLQCSSEEAYRIMAEAMGGAELYSGGSKTDFAKIPRYRLTQEECKVLRLYPKFSPTVATVRTSNGEARIQDGLYVLWQRNPDAYFGMIIKRAKEMKKKYQYLRVHFASDKADLAYQIYDLLGEYFDHSVYRTMNRILEERIQICDKIITIFTKARNPQKPAI